MSKQRLTAWEKTAKDAIKYTFMESMEFELGMRQILGEKAYHSFDVAAVPKSAIRLLLKATKELSIRVDEIITMDSRLHERLLSDIGTLQTQISGMTNTPCRIHIIGQLFKIISRLLGYDWMDGNIYRTPVYFRTKSQEYKDHIKHMANWRDWQNEENEVILQRRKICLQLDGQGWHKNQISRVLNISEYEVEQLITDCRLAEIAKLKEEGRPWDEIARQFHDGGPDGFLSLYKRRSAARKRRSA